MENNIIVIGGRGFVGHYLINKLYKSTNSKIYCVDCNLTGIERDKIKSDRVKYYSTDLIGPSKTINTVKFIVDNVENISTIFHFGEYSRVVPSLNNIDTVVESNVKLTIDIINLCRRKNIKLIYSASSTRFNSDGDIDTKTCNKLPYPYFKSLMVDTIKRFGEWYNLDYNIAYFYNVYGEGQVSEGEYATVIGIWENQYRNNLPISVIGDGNQTRDFTHIDDIVEGLYLIYRSGTSKHEYHLGTCKDYKIKELAELFNRPIQYLPKIEAERNSGRAPLDNLANTELGWKAKNDIVDYIKSIVK